MQNNIDQESILALSKTIVFELKSAEIFRKKFSEDEYVYYICVASLNEYLLSLVSNFDAFLNRVIEEYTSTYYIRIPLFVAVEMVLRNKAFLNWQRLSKLGIDPAYKVTIEQNSSAIHFGAYALLYKELL